MFGPLFPKSRKLAAPTEMKSPRYSPGDVVPIEELAASATIPWIEKKRDYAVTRPSGDVEVFTGYTEVRPGEGGALEFWSPYQRELILHSSQWISVHVVEPET